MFSGRLTKFGGPFALRLYQSQGRHILFILHLILLKCSSSLSSALTCYSDMEEHKTFYSSRAWKDARRNYKQSVGGLCEECLKKGIISPAEIVHHKVPLTDENVSDISISLSWDNLQALCRPCHAKAHEQMYAERTGKRYTIDDNGRVIIRDSVL